MRKYLPLLIIIPFLVTSCVSNKEFESLQAQYDSSQTDLEKCGVQLNDQLRKLASCEQETERLKASLANEKQQSANTLNLRQEQINDLKDQIADIRKQRDAQLEQVGDLTVLSKSANDNIKETLSQLDKKDQYISLLQKVKSKADSINLALAVNLKSVLNDGVFDEDVDVKVDKTVVFINLSDKMLYKSGSATINSRAKDVLGKIASIVQSRPEFEVMVEGYTDNLPIRNSCMSDNWDLSVKRATSVVRVLQKDWNIDPNRLIAAGRGEYNVLASNETYEGRQMNRRTRIIIMPRIDQFYDLLAPENLPD